MKQKQRGQLTLMQQLRYSVQFISDHLLDGFKLCLKFIITALSLVYLSKVANCHVTVWAFAGI